MLKLLVAKVGESFPVNEELAGLVPIASNAEQASLNIDIAENGLREPIVLWRGKIVDGRCRQKACIFAGVKIEAKELDDELTEDEVRVFVKSVNTRRNLTQTQKIISACKDSLNNNKKSIVETAKAWGIGDRILKNARYIAKEKPEFIEPLFNGRSVTIINQDGQEVDSNKVSTIYAYIKREAENSSENTDHAWNDASFIKTQKGKEFYYSAIKGLDNSKHLSIRMHLAELANYKFPKN